MVLVIGKTMIAPHNTYRIREGTKNLVVYKYFVWVVIATIIGALQGCAAFSMGGYGPDRQSREDFERRVEAAFRLENRMTSEIMALQGGEDVGVENYEAVFQAEQVMEKNCNDLNDYVSRDIDGLSKGFLLLKRVENSVVGCETAAHRVEELLKAH
jgi:hypothetical protein